MRNCFLLTIFSAFTLATSAQSPSDPSGPPSTDVCAIVPQPAKIFRGRGEVALASLKHIRIADPAFNFVALYLQQEILDHTGSTLAISATAPGKSVSVVFNKDPDLSDAG